MANETLSEEYRFTFLYYLKTVKLLLELSDAVNSVTKMHGLVGCGGEYSSEDWVDIVNSGKYLFFRYGMDYSLPGFTFATKQLLSEVEILKKQERRLFKDLRALVSKLKQEDETWWLFDDAAKHRRFLINDPLSMDRANHYEKKLADFGEEPLSPYSLEASFGCFHESLKHLMF